MKITGPMLRHQAVLGARSLRDIARDPRRTRGLGRLVATGGRSTMRLRLPWLPFPLIDVLEAAVVPGARVFEYGGGGSTLWFLDRGASVVTVEHHPDWARTLRSVIDNRDWTLLERGLEDDAQAYVEAISEFPDGEFDVVVVDGRERVRCALAALDKVRPGGLLILDDIDRDRYAPALEGIAWPRTDYVAFAPAKPTLAYSAAFERPATE